MASIRKYKDRWRAAIDRKGIRKSKIFPTKQAAKDWAAREEHLILHGGPPGTLVTFGEAMDRYAREVSPKKRGHRWEVIRLEKFKTHAIAGMMMSDLSASNFAQWRDERLLEVSPGSVNREMTLMSGVLSISRKEWGYINVNPISDVRKPSKPPPRDRIVTDSELAALLISAGSDLENRTARSFHAFLFAIETAMRAGEILSLTWGRIDIATRVAHLPMTKNGTSRNVPLSTEAVRLLRALPVMDPVFGLRSDSLDALWRKLRDRAAVKDLTFHDSRHVAITRLARKLDVLDLARMVGHRNISQLMAYYNEPASEIAKRLD